MRTYLAVYAFGSIAACTTAQAPPAAVALSAVDDQVLVEMDVPTDISVLDNDVGVAATRVVSLADAPAHGTATLDATGVLHYQPAAEYLGDDLVHYQIENPDGTVASAAVAIGVHCTTCAIGAAITLAWDGAPAGEVLVGYRVFMGPTEDPATVMLIDDIPLDRPGFVPAMPTVSYDGWADLHLRLNDHVCFRLKAYNAAGESDFSNAACANVTAHGAAFTL
jgi:hypothetical protein